ncbi:MAG: acetate---CoA ligase (ADP-forming) subunit beta [Archaeoglobi archaeon]|nr:acetate---CoA ligase (ADP-forming) subunit beta [Archaeoglobi archaeon]
MSRILTEYEASRLLQESGIPMAGGYLARNPEEAISSASKIGYPVVMKVMSPDILHKSDAGCVKVGISNEEEVRRAYEELMMNARKYKSDAEIQGILVQKMAEKGLETILGVVKDQQFGHVVMFGLGGIFVEVLRDVSFRVTPLTRRDAREMIDELRTSKILYGVRGMPPYDVDFLVETILRLSEFAEAHPEISELDINPFVLYEEGKGGMGLDALIRIE